MLILVLSGGIIILPGVVPHFFTGAAAGCLEMQWVVYAVRF